MSPARREQMITVQDAAKAALQFFKQMYTKTYINPGIEEFEKSEDGKYWLITIGFDLPGTAKTPPFQQALGISPRMQREYKLFKVGTEDGLVYAMKIRTV